MLDGENPVVVRGRAKLLTAGRAVVLVDLVANSSRYLTYVSSLKCGAASDNSRSAAS
jgi:hypothetical protein